MKEILKEYIISEYGLNKLDQVLKENRLNVQYLNDTHNIELLLNMANVMRLEDELLNICKLFDDKKLKYITFKGVVLSNLLYENKYSRSFCDIDIFVTSENFKKALTILCDSGYSLRDPNTLQGVHHAVLKKDNVVLELHRNILNPFTSIDETYIRNHTKKISITGTEITTFDTTATLLHLIYHLYMDTYLACGNLYSIFANRNYPKAGRFLYRAYEITLFSEKYFNEIKWADIENDLKNQKLRIIFKIMIFDILEIFPEAFPQSFVDTICKLNYIDDPIDQFYECLFKLKKNKNIDELLCKYINDNWQARKKKNININIGETISLRKELLAENNQALTCNIATEKLPDGLKLIFKVSNDDFFISDIKNYDTQASDGIHLILCGTEQYSYNSIFLFPKNIDGKIKVVACDVLNNKNEVLDNNSINAEFFKSENEYIITTVLSNEFLKENHIYSYFYMGLVVSDCSSETQHRKNQLILSEKSSEWYNPIYFARINIK